MKAVFKVQHDVLSGLRYMQVVKRKGISVAKEEEMLVSLLFCCVPRRLRPRVNKGWRCSEGLTRGAGVVSAEYSGQADV